MSVLGVDFGNDNCVIALARRRGVDVVANDLSNRATPSVVSFTPKQRLVGESGANQATMNWKNTIFGIKSILGLKYNSEEGQREMARLPYKFAEGKNGEILVEVFYKGQQRQFEPYRIVAMILQQLRQYAETDNGTRVVDAVISVPLYYTDNQRRDMINAAKVAGLNCLKLMNENTAAGLYFGMFNQEPQEEPINIAFCDLGHSASTISVVKMDKSKMSVLASGWNTQLGIRELDEMLINYFAQEIKKKHNLDVNSNPKARLRLAKSVTKLKKVLSANPKGTLNIECLMEDTDISFSCERETLENMAQEYLERFKKMLAGALEESGVSTESLHHVEMIGGGSFIPCLKHAITDVFGQEPRVTMNASEAVGRGCAIQGAILSPSFRVRDFAVSDTIPYSISIGWKSKDGEAMDTDELVNKKSVIFKRFSDSVPSTKMLTFTRSEDFYLVAQYEEAELLPGDATPFIARFDVKNKASQDGEPSKIKVRIKQNVHGILALSSAQKIEEVEVEEPVPKSENKEQNKDENQEEQNDNEESEKQENEEPQTRKVTKTIKTDLSVSVSTPGRTPSEVESAANEETSMQMDDRAVIEIAEKKNEVESYVYDNRSRIGEYGDLQEFIKPQDAEQFLELLNQTEDWLYTDEGDDASLSEYSDRLAQMQKYGESAKMRKEEHERRDEAAEALMASVNKYRADASSGDEKYSHIEQKDKDSIIEKCNNAEQWLRQKLDEQSKIPKTENPVVKCSEMESKKKDLDTYCPQILCKPKPKPKSEPKKEDNKQKQEQQGEGAKQGQEQESGNQESKEDAPQPMEEEGGNSDKNPEDMDLD
eukprot:gb/GECH01012357.1/.p1 GENE.gb/GECH01012357.1/~~gb/GECH01012357.1/.p1  ORF type:complete len:824 (+),score=230.29 gb/GECH01012357.1/:1-2472(+)